MSALATLCAALAAAIEPGASATSEVRAGQAPLIAGDEPRATFATVFDGRVDLVLKAPRLIARFGYAPRALWRQPNLTGELRPIVLHQVRLAADWEATRTTHADAQADAAVGEVDYLGLREVLGPEQRALPASQQLFILNAAVSAQRALDRRTNLGGGLVGNHLRALDTPPVPADEAAPLTLPAVTLLQASAHATREQTRTTTVRAEFQAQYQHISLGLATLTVLSQLSLEQSTSPHGTLSAGLGLAHTTMLENRVSSGTAGGVIPIGHLSGTGRLLAQRGLQLTGGAGLRVTWFLDPILATGGPMGTAEVSLSARANRNVGIVLRAAAMTSLRAEPRAADLNESLFTASLGVRHDLDRALTIEGGARYAEQAPHVRAESFRLNQRELWAYLRFEARTLERTPAGTRAGAITR